jgi:hypothetical protein
MRHQFADALPFADTRPLDLEHRFAEQQLGRLGWECHPCGSDVTAQLLGMFWRLPVVQGERIVLVLDDNAWPDADGVCKPAAQIGGQRLRPTKTLAVIDAHLGAVAADRGQRQRRKQAIKIGDTPAAYQCDRTARQFVQPCERTEQCI